MAAPALPDVNVLIALAWPQYPHHQRAHRWFGAHHAQGWVTTPVTESGFVRASSNRSPRWLPYARRSTTRKVSSTTSVSSSRRNDSSSSALTSGPFQNSSCAARHAATLR